MNKKLFLKLVLILLVLSLVSCGQRNNSISENHEELLKDVQPSAEEDKNKYELFNVAGGTNKVPGICEYYLDNLKVTPIIEPSIVTESSISLKVQTEDTTYLDLILNVQNSKNEAQMADDIITVKIKTGTNEYSCFSVVESVDGSTLENSPLINPLEARKIHYVAEVSLAEATGEIEVILTINGENFSNKFNL